MHPSGAGHFSIPTRVTRPREGYSELAQQSGNAASVVTLPPDGDGHCDFTDDQIDAAFDDLVKWADTRVGPGVSGAAGSANR